MQTPACSIVTPTWNVSVHWKNKVPRSDLFIRLWMGDSKSPDTIEGIAFASFRACCYLSLHKSAIPKGNSWSYLLCSCFKLWISSLILICLEILESAFNSFAAFEQQALAYLINWVCRQWWPTSTFEGSGRRVVPSAISMYCSWMRSFDIIITEI